MLYNFFRIRSERVLYNLSNKKITAPPPESEEQKESFMYKLASFIVDKRNLFFLLFIFALIFSVFAKDWVNVENDITKYLAEDTETRQSLTIMDEEFVTYGTACSCNRLCDNPDPPIQ